MCKNGLSVVKWKSSFDMYKIYILFIFVFGESACVMSMCVYDENWPTNIRSYIYFISRKFDSAVSVLLLLLVMKIVAAKKWDSLSHSVALTCIIIQWGDNLIRISIYAECDSSSDYTRHTRCDSDREGSQAGRQAHTVIVLCHRLSYTEFFFLHFILNFFLHTIHTDSCRKSLCILFHIRIRFKGRM